MNIGLENTTFDRFNVSSSINHTHFWYTIRIQIILLDEQIQIMTSLYTSSLYVQPAARQVCRDHLKSATLKRDTPKIFNNFTLTQCVTKITSHQWSPVGCTTTQEKKAFA